MKLHAEISEPPFIEDGRIKVGITVRDHESGRAWTMESDLSEGAGGSGVAQTALPFDVVKQAEDALFLYVARREVASQLRVLREQVVPHAMGVTYRPMVGMGRKDGKSHYFLKG